MLVSWACNLCNSHRIHIQKCLTLGLMFYCFHLEILNNLVFELIYCKWSLMGHCGLCKNRRDKIAVEIACNFLDLPHECRILVEIHNAWVFSKIHNKFKVSMSYPKLSGALTAPRGYAFRWNQNLLSDFPTQMTEKQYHTLSYLYYFPILTNHLH